MSMEPTEKEIDDMVASEIEHAEIESRKSTREKLYDKLSALKLALENQKRIVDSITETVGKLGKV